MTPFPCDPIDLVHGADSSTTPEVQVLCRGSSSCEAVLIVGSKHSRLASLTVSTHSGTFRLFEKGFQSSDEVLLVHVFYGNSRHHAALCYQPGPGCCTFHGDSHALGTEVSSFIAEIIQKVTLSMICFQNATPHALLPLPAVLASSNPTSASPWEFHAESLQ
ncbi:hypothetical protein P7K49_010263 [Saguinus oedipus]|uniref:Uncharacterized protein n=1 Tax=Saguinus oedipus TaxID=9490 RepID=A0ABQ9VMS8_SAGOE|nr:hypothetical protein P7K49_010263 [Saguinus oedipus]